MSTETIDQSSAVGQIVTHEPRDTAVMPGFSNAASWDLAQRVAKAFASSSLVPQAYQGNIANCLIALEMANRMGASPLMVMQSLYIVHGTPSWSSKFLIACFNQCGRFSSLRYEWNSERTSCRAWAIEKATGERLDGPTVTLQMAKDEGWSTKSGSKWRTMPELMMCYRAAAFFIRTYAPEISMGLQTDDEVIDITPTAPKQSASSIDKVRQLLTTAAAPAVEAPPTKTLAQYRDEIVTATSAETAALALDAARDELNATDMAALGAYYRECWE